MKVKVLVRPKSSKSSLSEPSEFERKKCDIVASVKSPPLEGRANEEVLSLLEGRFPGKRAALVSGAKGKLKVFELL